MHATGAQALHSIVNKTVIRQELWLQGDGSQLGGLGVQSEQGKLGLCVGVDTKPNTVVGN